MCGRDGGSRMAPEHLSPREVERTPASLVFFFWFERKVRYWLDYWAMKITTWVFGSISISKIIFQTSCGIISSFLGRISPPPPKYIKLVCCFYFQMWVFKSQLQGNSKYECIQYNIFVDLVYFPFQNYSVYAIKFNSFANLLCDHMFQVFFSWRIHLLLCTSSVIF